MRIPDDERRARLVRRHRLDRSAADVHDAAQAVVAVHSSDPLTPHLALWARVPDYATDDLDRALADERTLLRMHAMRRTLFVIAADDAQAVAAAATRDVAAKERTRLLGWLKAEVRQPAKWLAKLEAQVARELGDREHSTKTLAEAVPEMATPVTLGSGKWTQRSPIGSRVLFLMAMDGRVVRTRPTGSWKSSQYRWVSGDGWEEMDVAAASAELAARYLATHGPATFDDLRWWTGWTVKRTRAALDANDVVTVELSGGTDGFVLGGDLETTRAARTAVALLPGLDPTPMGFKHRDFYLGDHGARLFDKNGNVGPTVWVGGRIVGGWAVGSDGAVVVELLEPVAKRAKAAIDREARALTAWLDGVSVTPRFRTPLERELTS